MPITTRNVEDDWNGCLIWHRCIEAGHVESWPSHWGVIPRNHSAAATRSLIWSFHSKSSTGQSGKSRIACKRLLRTRDRSKQMNSDSRILMRWLVKLSTRRLSGNDSLAMRA